MTQEEKDLLLKDLCARLPYGVKVRDELGRINKLVIGNADLIRLYYNDFSLYSEEKLSLPYLFPLSSMTEEQYDEYNDLNSCELGCFPHTEDALDYLIENHFDFRGLIERGLAIDATGKNIY